MRSMTLMLLAGMTLISGCQKDNANSDPQPVVLRSMMKNVVAPQAQILWDVSNRALNDAGEPQASKLTADDWAKLSAAGQKVKAQADAIVSASKITVSKPGQKIQDEGITGGSTTAQVQGFIDADRTSFADMAKALSVSADQFITAAHDKDVVKMNQASGDLDQVCESCHVRYWYPQQAKPK